MSKFKINKSYAENYNKWRQKEEMAKLKDRYGGPAMNVDSEESSSESEDEDAEGLTEEIERDWMNTLAALKSKDPIIYKKDAQFYHGKQEEPSDEDSKKKKKKEKPVYLKDYERKIITEKGGVLSDEEMDGEEARQKEKPSYGYYEEQDHLKKSFLEAAKDLDDDSGDELIKTKTKRKKNKQKEDPSKEWLNSKDDETDKLEPLKSYWNNPGLERGEQFLRDYILNKKYIDQDDTEGFQGWGDDDDDYSDEEELLVKQESFERTYNFRFEEPDADQVKTFPRTLQDSVRRKDTKRAEKRHKVKERKLKEKELKKEEIKQLKNLKKQEILGKIEKLKEITGNQDIEFNEEDLEKDFDPEEYDRMMQRQFSENYYDEGDIEGVKPVFQDSGDEFDDGNWDEWKGPSEDTAGYYGVGEAEYYEPNVDDPDFNMDADYDPATAPKKSKKKKKKNKLAQALAAEKPVYDPDEKPFDQYLDEYYSIDYEDIIDGMPCRFKYRKTTANAYGLTPDEVLNAPDTELNAWASVKKMSQYRSEQEEIADVNVYARKGRNQRKKQNILYTLYNPKAAETEDASEKLEINTDGSQVNKKKKNKHKKFGTEEETNEMDPSNHDKAAQSESDRTKGDDMETSIHSANRSYDRAGTSHDTAKRSHDRSKQETSTKGKKRKKNRQYDDKLKMSDERLKAYGINPKKYKHMKKADLQFKSQN